MYIEFSFTGGHTTCAYAENLYIFGGGSGTHFVNDLNVFNTGMRRWNSGFKWIVFIFLIFNFSVAFIFQLLQNGKTLLLLEQVQNSYCLRIFVIFFLQKILGPTARSRHTAVFVGCKMFVFFGGDDSRVYNDVHVFDAGTTRRKIFWRQFFHRPFRISYLA